MRQSTLDSWVFFNSEEEPKMQENINQKLELVGIRLENYRSYKKFPEDEDYLELGRFTTLIGKNDVGKSNLLRAIKAFLENEDISPDDIHKGHNAKCEITLVFKVSEELKPKLKEKFANVYDGGNVLFISKIVEEDEFSNGKSKSRGKYYINSKKVAYNSIQPFLPKVLFIPAVKNVEDELKFGRDTLISKLLFPIIEKTSQEKAQTDSVADLKRRLTNAIKRETMSIRKKLKKELSKMWSDVEEVTIEVPELKLEKAFTPIIKVKDKYTKKETPITYRGSGMQRYFILALLEIYRAQKIGKGYVLLFEEPEIYLHVGAQKKLCGILQEFSKEGQVIISTHSSVFVNSGELSTSYLLVKENGETKLRKFTGSKEILEELGMSPSDIFLTDGIIFVEGPSDREILQIFAKALFSKWEEYNIAIIPIGGSNINHQDPEILSKVNPNIAVILDSDIKNEGSDLSPKKKELKQKFEEKSIPVYFWEKNGKIVRAIENLFTRNAVNSAFPILKENEIELENEIGPYDDVPLILGKKFAEIAARKNPKLDISSLSDKEFREYYDKIKHGRKIAQKMVELNEIPTDVKELLKDILNRFGMNN
ncbi:ATP-dependent endonuclease [Thermococcus aggregans]|uniref:ATP-dependent endonuclease n=1 Tax=Thermococcus aggregans TaxID=110163 RepID=A0A9E7SPJ0_THEAG|nr:AAA family ATPase [Thermococcus aggregans]USS41574.1 ATP-dependent endonuclease [Thermococcus aggregans]